MKELSIKIDDDLYRRASRKVEDLETEVNPYVTEFLEALNGDDKAILDARAHMSQLFSTTRGFGVGVRPTREEMHERGGHFKSLR
jgi:DNA replication initiation complex subunit (GINS family)